MRRRRFLLSCRRLYTERHLELVYPYGSRLSGCIGAALIDHQDCFLTHCVPRSERAILSPFCISMLHPLRSVIPVNPVRQPRATLLLNYPTSDEPMFPFAIQYLYPVGLWFSTPFSEFSILWRTNTLCALRMYYINKLYEKRVERQIMKISRKEICRYTWRGEWRPMRDLWRKKLSFKSWYLMKKKYSVTIVELMP